MAKQRIENSTLHERAESALRDAIERVVEENARLGLPIYIERDGKLVDIGPEEAAKRGFPPKNGSPK